MRGGPSHSRVHVCTFEAVDLKKGDLSDYDAFRQAVLTAGRFSVFEATETMAKANMFTRLSKDPTVCCTPEGFPWTKVEEITP